MRALQSDAKVSSIIYKYIKFVSICEHYPHKLMLDFHTLAEFSRSNCVSICAFLVPANLLTTILTMILTALHRPSHQVWQSAGIASIFALVMVMHVYSWFVVGIVMLPTYILLCLAITCLLINLAAILWLRRSPNLTVAINTTSE
ncbi:hypothetical protein NIES2100_06070 [Calothrix sp. NIES-2100]|nr:hypothetical protein NIES2100_06070 [Calothrix sp. NIES-2100]